MPELPEIETIARGLSGSLVGRVIEQVQLSRVDILHGLAVPLCAALHGRRIAEIVRVGKRLRIDIVKHREPDAAAMSLHVHLGMSGRLIAVDRDAPLLPHTHLRLVLRRSRRELRFSDPRRFGGLWLVNGHGSNGCGWLGRRLPPAGVDPLTLPPSAWKRLLERRRQVKALLLDQQIVGGIGNIYCDEALHRAGIHPLTRACDLDREAVGRLGRTLKRVLNEAIRAGGSSISDYRTADNTEGGFQRRHRVYDRQGHPCRKCGTMIERLIVAGRSTFICPACQRANQ